MTNSSANQKTSTTTNLTRNAGDKVLIKPVKTVTGKWHNCIGEIVTVHPTSGCYTVIIGETQLVFFEQELEEISVPLNHE